MFGAQVFLGGDEKSGRVVQLRVSPISQQHHGKESRATTFRAVLRGHLYEQVISPP
jgi:hypothetical protein